MQNEGNIVKTAVSVDPNEEKIVKSSNNCIFQDDNYFLDCATLNLTLNPECP